MSEQENSRLQDLFRKLETERDELRVKLNLAKLEARDEWDGLERKMDSLKGRMKVLGEEAKDAGEDVGAAFDVLANEIKEGFARLRKLI